MSLSVPVCVVDDPRRLITPWKKADFDVSTPNRPYSQLLCCGQHGSVWLRTRESGDDRVTTCLISCDGRLLAETPVEDCPSHAWLCSPPSRPYGQTGVLLDPRTGEEFAVVLLVDDGHLHSGPSATRKTETNVTWFGRVNLATGKLLLRRAEDGRENIVLAISPNGSWICFSFDVPWLERRPFDPATLEWTGKTQSYVHAKMLRWVFLELDDRGYLWFWDESRCDSPCLVVWCPNETGLRNVRDDSFKWVPLSLSNLPNGKTRILRIDETTTQARVAMDWNLDSTSQIFLPSLGRLFTGSNHCRTTAYFYAVGRLDPKSFNGRLRFQIRPGSPPADNCVWWTTGGDGWMAPIVCATDSLTNFCVAKLVDFVRTTNPSSAETTLKSIMPDESTFRVALGFLDWFRRVTPLDAVGGNSHGFVRDGT